MSVALSETESKYIVSGIDGYDFVSAAERQLNFKNNYSYPIFDFSESQISFRKFFIDDFYFILQEFISTGLSDISYSILTEIKSKLLLTGWCNKLQFSKRTVSFNKEKLNDFVFTPRDYQKRFFDFYAKGYRENSYKGCVLIGDVGSGKTYMGLATLACREVDIVVAITPLQAMHDVWVRSISGFKDEEMDIEYESIFKEPNKSWNSFDNTELDLYCQDCKYYIFHYEKLGLLETLIRLNPDKRFGILIDESHSFNEENSKRSKTLIAAAKTSKSEDILWLSATPIKGRSKEIIPMFKSLDANLDTSALSILKKTFKEDEGIRLINNRIKKISFRIDREEYMDTPPPNEMYVYVKMNNSVDSKRTSKRYEMDQIQIDGQRYSDLRAEFLMNDENKHIKEYFDLLNYFRFNYRDFCRHEHKDYIGALWACRKYDEEFGLGADGKLCKRYEKIVLKELLKNNRFIERYRDDEHSTARAKFIERFEFLVKVVKLPKIRIKSSIIKSFYHHRRIECFGELTKHYDLAEFVRGSNKKTVIFADNISPIHKADIVLNNSCIKSLEVNSSTKKKMPARLALKKFRTEDDVRVICTTFKSMGSSIGMTEADQVVLLDQSYRHHIKKQAIGRCDRPGQTNQVNVLNLLLDTGDKENVTGRTFDINERSKEIANNILKNSCK